MPGLRHNTIVAIRAALVADGTLTALVPATKIRTGYNPTPTDFPCIAIRIDGGRDGYANHRAGTLFVTSYTADDQPQSALSAIDAAIDSVLDESSLDLSNNDVAFHLMLNFFESPVIPEAEIREDVFSIALQYSYASSAK
jgi:hypothetical protein